MSEQFVKKALTTGVIDAPFFIPGRSETMKETEDEYNYGVLKGTPLEGTDIEGLYLGIKNKDNGFSVEVNDEEIVFLSPDEIMERNVFGDDCSPA